MGNPQTVVVGPNHALHGVLTLLTVWACGGWAWIWLFVALQNRRHVAAVDERGRVVRPAAQYDQLGAVFIGDDGSVRWVNVAAAAGLIAAVVLLFAVINL